MPSILVGLLCRFLGARFVASSQSGCVAVVIQPAQMHHIRIRVSYTAERIYLEITVNGPDGAASIRKSSTTPPQETNDAAFTSAVAAWIIPHLAAVAGPSTSEPGISSVKRISRADLLVAIAAFSGHPLKTDNTGKSWAGKKNIVLWPRHIVIKTKKGDQITPFPSSVEMKSTDDGDFQYAPTTPHAPAHAVDTLIVDACRAAVLA